MTRNPPTIWTKYPSSRSLARSALRLNSARDIEDRPLLDGYRTVRAQLAGVRLRGRLAVGHGEHDVGFVRTREGQLDDLLEGHGRTANHARTRVNDDFDFYRRSRGVVEAFDAWSAQVDQHGRFDENVGSATHLEEHRLFGPGLSDLIENAAADCGLAPALLVIVDLELEFAVGEEGDEALGASGAEVERFIEAHVLEVAGREDREQAVTSVGFKPRRFEHLAAQRDRIGNGECAKVEVLEGELEAIGPCRPQAPAFAEGIANIIKFGKFRGSHFDLSFGLPEQPGYEGTIGTAAADRKGA